MTASGSSGGSAAGRSGIPFKAGHARHVHYVTGDDGLATAFEEGHSYTGEQTLELSVHGSPVSVQALIEACLGAGARMAEPGEFTYRAFMNGRLDLSRAEGVRDTVRAQTDAQLRQANLLREGGLRAEVSDLRETLVGVLAAVEASTDFSEEIGDVDSEAALERLSSVKDKLDNLYISSKSARIVREGLTVAIIGRPNAGKSSLLNAIVGADRAIVTPVPGTTRDTLEETVCVHGVPVRLIDTAGLRETQDTVEMLGVQRSKDALANADQVWYVFDATVGWGSEDASALAEVDRPTTLVANKCDLLDPSRDLATASTLAGPDTGKGRLVSVSAVTGDGIAGLLGSLVALETGGPSESPVALPNRRHAPLLQEAAVAVQEAIETLTRQVPDDLAVVHLRAAVRSLGEITGETAAPDIIERVFHDFCIGK